MKNHSTPTIKGSKKTYSELNCPTKLQPASQLTGVNWIEDVRLQHLLHTTLSEFSYEMSHKRYLQLSAWKKFSFLQLLSSKMLRPNFIYVVIMLKALFSLHSKDPVLRPFSSCLMGVRMKNSLGLDRQLPK
jgi:hypothetical protein